MATIGLGAVGQALPRIWRDGGRVERIAYVVAAVLVASGLTHACVLLVSGGSWTGPVSLRKPTTFGLSFGTTLATVAWATSLVRARSTAKNVLLGLFTVVCVVETSLVSMQAWRGVPSHFNRETAVDSTVSTILAAGGAAIILICLGFTAVVFNARPVSPSMRLALRFGFVTLLVALAAGAIMIARGVAQTRAGHPMLAYTTAGALKPLHAVAMHGILVVPGVAWLLGLGRVPDRRQLALTGAAVGGYGTLTGVVAYESLSGIDPLHASAVPAAVSLVAVLLLLATVSVALAAALRRSPSRTGDEGTDAARVRTVRG